MLYKLTKTGSRFDQISPLPFTGLPLEKDLENLLAENLFDVLFEGNELMPIWQERVWQPEADIYALNKEGDLVIFELKRDHTGEGAVHQALRYCEKAARMGYEKLQEKLCSYHGGKQLDLQEEHRAAFELEHPLDRSAFNRKQHLMVVGSAGDERLIQNVDYWRSQGLSLNFIPYRVYEIGGESYFEFFSLPYDRHSNPKDAKGVIFDTCRTYIPDSIWYMCEKDRVAAFGGQSHVVNTLNPKDFVFLYHKGAGIVAAGQVKGGVVKDDPGEDASYRDIEWLTQKPKRGEPIHAMSAAEISSLFDCGFFWARTIKVPYLTLEESDQLLGVLREKLGRASTAA